MDLSRREFIQQVGIGKTARLLGGLMGSGLFGLFGMAPEGSPDEAARELARRLTKKTARAASATQSGAAGSGSVSET